MLILHILICIQIIIMACFCFSSFLSTFIWNDIYLFFSLFYPVFVDDLMSFIFQLQGALYFVRISF